MAVPNQGRRGRVLWGSCGDPRLLQELAELEAAGLRAGCSQTVCASKACSGLCSLPCSCLSPEFIYFNRNNIKPVELLCSSCPEGRGLF